VGFQVPSGRQIGFPLKAMLLGRRVKRYHSITEIRPRRFWSRVSGVSFPEYREMQARFALRNTLKAMQRAETMRFVKAACDGFKTCATNSSMGYRREYPFRLAYDGRGYSWGFFAYNHRYHADYKCTYGHNLNATSGQSRRISG
jgi:hypothetical protein